jgi:SAM-dependent methyltransferase
VLYEDAARDVAARYRSRPAHYYVRSKLRIDPVARALVARGEAEAFGEVVDVACGRGQLSLLLRVLGLASAIVGLDWDEGKVATATEAAGALGAVTFTRADVREAPLPAADTVLLIDVLHYLTRDEQDALLVRAARAARGRVIVRDVDPDAGAASALTHAWEWATTSLGYNRGARVAPRSFDEITSVLEGEGLRVSREPCAARAMSNVLLVARRAEPAR